MVRLVTIAIACASALILVAPPTFAAGKSKTTTPKEHSIVGTVEKVDGQTLTVKTSTHSESVTLAATTHITEHGKAIQSSQLAADTGAHVKVRYTESNGQKQAQAVTVTPATTQAKNTQPKK
jgi:hypothetical protein